MVALGFKPKSAMLSASSLVNWSSGKLACLACCVGLNHILFILTKGHFTFLYGLNVSPPNSFVEILTPMRVEPSWMGLMPKQKGPREISFFLLFKDTTSSILQPRRGLSPEPKHAGALILDFWYPELWEKNLLFLFCKTPTSQRYVTCFREWSNPSHTLQRFSSMFSV